MTPEKHERIVSFAESIIAQEIELLPGVQETLPVLAARHRLILMTKGNADEQSHKLARSGLAEYFSAVEIPHEKNPEAYQSVCARHSLSCRTTWMIGNSPAPTSTPRLPPACTLSTSTTPTPGFSNTTPSKLLPPASACLRSRVSLTSISTFSNHSLMQSAKEGAHLAQHVRFIRQKCKMISTRQRDHVRCRHSIFNRFLLSVG